MVMFLNIPPGRAVAAPDAAEEDGAVLAPDAVFVAEKDHAVEPVPHNQPAVLKGTEQ
jgi:hypothetical protein